MAQIEGVANFVEYASLILQNSTLLATPKIDLVMAHDNSHDRITQIEYINLQKELIITNCISVI